MLAEAQSEHQSRYRKAKSVGIDIEAMKLAISLGKLDPAIAAARIRNALSYMSYAGEPAVTQMDLFHGVNLEEALGLTPPSEKSKAKYTEYEAEMAGIAEGKAGGSIDNLNKVYGADSPAGAAAVRGYQRGQAMIANKMKPGASAGTAGGTGRRGGRGKAKDAQAEKAMAEVVDLQERREAVKPIGDFDELEIQASGSQEPGDLPDGSGEAEEPGDTPDSEAEEPNEDEAVPVDPAALALRSVRPEPAIDLSRVSRLTISQMETLVEQATGVPQTFASRQQGVTLMTRIAAVQQGHLSPGAMH